MLALDFLGICLPDRVLLRLYMPLVGPPTVGEIARDAKGEGVSDLLILEQTDTPNTYRLIKSPLTMSCMRSILKSTYEKASI
jgi:hypothetical protein